MFLKEFVTTRRGLTSTSRVLHGPTRPGRGRSRCNRCDDSCIGRDREDRRERLAVMQNVTQGQAVTIVNWWSSRRPASI